MRHTLILIITLGLCFAAQSLALRAVGGRTAKSESNFFSSIGRIQAGAQGKADLMVLGSSITGRLPDRAQGFPGTANMGCDGGSAVDALRAMDRGILPNAPQLFIEANTLHLALNPKPTEIGLAVQGPWFHVGLRIPNLAAYARPAGFLYSKLLASRIGGTNGLEFTEDLKASGLPEMITHVSAPPCGDFQEEKLIAEISGILRRLQQRGSQTTILWLPPARGDAWSEPPAWILEIARRSGARWWDLGQQAAASTVTLTDGVHMAAPSAARTMNSIRKAAANSHPESESSH